MAREIGALFGLRPRDLPIADLKDLIVKNGRNFSVAVKDGALCPRYIGAYVENVKAGPSPKWLRDALVSVGFQSVNNVVDVMNYVMLETGQPLHAFDYDKVESRKITVRRSRKGEKITTLDGKLFSLDAGVLLIADSKGPLAIAGVKGGKRSGVTQKTRRIIVESASFDSGLVYRTSRNLGLSTDASQRFSHDLSLALPEIGMARALQLLLDVAEAKPLEVLDSYSRRQSKEIIKFDVGAFRKLTGIKVQDKEAADFLRRLGFEPKIYKNKPGIFSVEVPSLRLDISNFEDLAEEVARFYGYGRIKSAPPFVALVPSESDEIFVFTDQLKQILTGSGLNEIYGHSFASKGDLLPGYFWRVDPVEVDNPLSAETAFLRPSLAHGLLKNVSHNFKFFDEVRLFEIGKIFYNGRGCGERLALGMVIASKKRETIFELKGMVEEIFRKFGLTDFWMRDLDMNIKFLAPKQGLRMESDHAAVGYMGKVNSSFEKGYVSFAEIDLGKLLELVGGEKEYEPLPKYPSVTRDVSFLVDRAVRIGEVLEVIDRAGAKYVYDADLIDEYWPPESSKEKQRSLTFRIVFQADNHTLTDEEAEKETKKIVGALRDKFNIILR